MWRNLYQPHDAFGVGSIKLIYSPHPIAHRHSDSAAINALTFSSQTTLWA